jgi:hypothetical protein
MSGEAAALLVDAAEGEVEDLSPIAGRTLQKHQRCFILAYIGDGEWRRLSGTVTCFSASKFCAEGCDGVTFAKTWESLPPVRKFLETFADEVPRWDPMVVVSTDLCGMFAVRARHLARMQNYSVGQIIIVREFDGSHPRLAFVRRVTDGEVSAEYVVTDTVVEEVTRQAPEIARFEMKDLARKALFALSHNKQVLIAEDGRPLCDLTDEWAETNWWGLFLLSVIFGPLVLVLFSAFKVRSRTPSEQVRALHALAWGTAISFLLSQVVWAIVFLK